MPLNLNATPRGLPVRAAALACALLLAGCGGRTVLAPDSAPTPAHKPALAAPPSSVMTPQGY